MNAKRVTLQNKGRGFCRSGEEKSKEGPSEKHIKVSPAKNKSHVAKKPNIVWEGGKEEWAGTSVQEVNFTLP